MKSTILVKIGSQLLTTPKGRLDLNNLRELVHQCAYLQKFSNSQIVLVSSGAITCGKNILNITCESVAEKQAAAAVGQINLCHQYKLFFNEKDCTIAQILLTKESFLNPKSKQHIQDTFSTLLQQNVIPIINENDTVSVDEINFGDNDQLAVEVAKAISASRVIFLTNVEGLYENPKEVSKGHIPWIKEVTAKEIDSCEASTHPNTRGGMLSKLLAAQKLLNMNIPGIIANGRTEDVLLKIIKGDNIGTHIQKSQPSFYKRSL